MFALLALSVLSQSDATPRPEFYPADRPLLVPIWNRVADVSPGLRSVESCAISPDGTWCVAGGKFGYAVSAWRTADGHRLWRGIHQSEVEAVAISSNGRFVASGAEDFTVAIWTREGKAVSSIELSSAIDALAWSNADETFAGGDLFVGDEDGVLHIFSPAQDTANRWIEAGSVSVGDTINSIDVAGDDATLVVGGNLQIASPRGGRHYDGFVRLVDIATRRVVKTFGPLESTTTPQGTRSGSIKSVRFSHDERRIAAGGFGEAVHVFDVASGERVGLINPGWRVEAVEFTPEGHHLIVGGHGEALHWYDAETLTLVHQQPAIRCEYIELSRDGRLVLTGHEDSGLLSLTLRASDLQRKIGTPPGQASYHELADQQLDNRDLKEPASAEGAGGGDQGAENE